MDDKQIFQKGVVVEAKGNLLGIKGPNKKNKNTTSLLLHEDIKRWLYRKWR
jgi:hypothetical protein